MRLHGGGLGDVRFKRVVKVRGYCFQECTPLALLEGGCWIPLNLVGAICVYLLSRE